MPKVFNFRVIVEQDEDGYFIAEVPAIPACYTQGKTYEEAIENIKEVIELCLEVAKDDKEYKAKIDLYEDNPYSTKFIGVTEITIPAPV